MNWLIEGIKKFDTKIAIIHQKKEHSYIELYLEIKKMSEILSSEIKAGEVVSILSDYSFKSIALLLALYKNKNIIVPITTILESEINDKIKESFTNKTIRINDTLIIEKTKIDIKHQMITSLQDINHSGLILFSSGSTGKPKAMIHDFDKLVNHYQKKKEKSMNMILFLMFDHIGGLNTLLNI